MEEKDENFLLDEFLFLTFALVLAIELVLEQIIPLISQAPFAPALASESILEQTIPPTSQAPALDFALDNE